MEERYTLYHGTDFRIITMSEKERLDYFSIVKRVIDALWAYFKPLYTTQTQVAKKMPDGSYGFVSQPLIEKYRQTFAEQGKESVYSNLLQKLSMLEARDLGSGMYQYDSLYLSGDKNKACRYANCSFAGGEYGLIAYRLIEGFDIINPLEFTPDTGLLSDMDIVKAFSQENVADPIVVTIDGISPKDLLNEDGNPVSVSLFENGLHEYLSFRLCKTIDLKNYSIKHLRQ